MRGVTFVVLLCGLSAAVSCQNTPVSCSKLKAAGQTKTQNYVIDPDGPKGLKPFIVKCDMTKNPPEAIAHHKQEARTLVQGSEEKGSTVKSITYINNVTSSQLAALADSSVSCSQSVKYECWGSILTGYGWWHDRSGTKMTNWGTPTNTNGCPCKLAGNCAAAGGNCNCDKNDLVAREDAGTLKDKATLPITKLAFGDTGDSGEKGYFTVGPLVCMSDYNMELGDACTATGQCSTANSVCGATSSKCECAPGYETSGSTCTKVSCGKPVDVPNMIMTGASFLFGDNVTYACANGHEQESGGTQVTCGADKEWKGNTPYCGRNARPLTCRRGFMRIFNRCYYISNKKVTYQQAIQACVRIGGKLAVIDSYLYNYGILAYVHRNKSIIYYWINGVTIDKHKNWMQYQNGASLPFTNWCRGEPNNGSGGKEDCAHVYARETARLGCWNDARCYFKMNYVCQHP